MTTNIHGRMADEYHWLTAEEWNQGRLDALCALYSMPDPDVWDNPNADPRVDRLVGAGHTKHCARRIAWGDGVCECGLLATPGP